MNHEIFDEYIYCLKEPEKNENSKDFQEYIMNFSFSEQLQYEIYEYEDKEYFCDKCKMVCVYEENMYSCHSCGKCVHFEVEFFPDEIDYSGKEQTSKVLSQLQVKK